MHWTTGFFPQLPSVLAKEAPSELGILFGWTDFLFVSCNKNQLEVGHMGKTCTVFGYVLTYC